MRTRIKMWLIIISGLLLAILYLIIFPMSPESKFYNKYRSIYRAGNNTPQNLQDLYTKGFDKIATSTLLALIEQNSFCHSDAHELGKLIFKRSESNLAEAFAVCGKHCLDGCFHGTLMEAFKNPDKPSEELAHVSMDDFRKKARQICEAGANIQSPEECSHAIGHGILASTGSIERSLELCEVFTHPGIQYYCTTGVFMQRDIDFGQEDASGEDYLYPCDQFTGKYDVPCWRYKTRQLIKHYKDVDKVIELCMGLSNQAKIGCFHGLGNALYAEVLNEPTYLSTICMRSNSESAQLACIDGAIENVSLISSEAAKVACASLQEPTLAEFCDSIDGKKDALQRKTLQMYIH